MSTKPKSARPSGSSLSVVMVKPSGLKPRKGRPLRRRVAVRPPKRTFLVFCEGTRTEPEYLQALKQEPAVREVASVEIRIDMEASGAVPLTLVREATEARARNSQDQGDVDEVWCLFDVEWPQNHPNLDEAIDQAAQRDVRLAISNPCFELWLALHFDDQTAWLTTNDAGEIAARPRREFRQGVGRGNVHVPPLRCGATCPYPGCQARGRRHGLPARQSLLGHVPIP